MEIISAMKYEMYDTLGLGSWVIGLTICTYVLSLNMSEWESYRKFNFLGGFNNKNSFLYLLNL